MCVCPCSGAVMSADLSDDVIIVCVRVRVWPVHKTPDGLSNIFFLVECFSFFSVQQKQTD